MAPFFSTPLGTLCLGLVPTPCCLDTSCHVLQTALGAMFGTFNVRADRLSVLKTSFPEELILTGRAPEGAPKVISMVAFR